MSNFENVYMDNGATSFPKAPGVAEAMAEYILNNGSNVARGAYKNAMDASRIVYETRDQLCQLFDFEHPDHVVFTKNITESLNQAIKGLISKDDHVIISSMEHNAVLRPINGLGCEVTRVQGNIEGFISPNDIKDAITDKTKAIIMLHASNVCGTINDIDAIGKIAKDNDVLFIVDAAQTAGVIPISMKHIDILCFTGHKSLLGPTGIGGFLIQPHVVPLMKPLIEGGTGSASESELQPEHMPDKYESGTPNVVGIYGLHESLNYILSEGVENVHKKEQELVKYFFEKFDFDHVRIVGTKDLDKRTAVVSLDFETLDNAMVAFQLERTYHIATRVGMHCAPSAHKTLNTFPNGTVRVSFSYFTTKEEIDYLITSINEII